MECVISAIERASIIATRALQEHGNKWTKVIDHATSTAVCFAKTPVKVVLGI